MSDGITDGNRPPALSETLEAELNCYAAYGIAPCLTKRQAEEALQNCKDVLSLRSTIWHIRQAVDDPDKTDADRLVRLREILNASK